MVILEVNVEGHALDAVAQIPTVIGHDRLAEQFLLNQQPLLSLRKGSIPIVDLIDDIQGTHMFSDRCELAQQILAFSGLRLSTSSQNDHLS